MYDTHVNQTKFDIYLLGSYGYAIRDIIKKLNIALNEKAKEALRNQVRLPKIFYEQGWKRFLIYREVEKKTKDIHVLLEMLIEGFDNGSWIKEELAAYDWQFIFEFCDYGETIEIGNVGVDTIHIAIAGSRPFIVLNGEYIMTSKDRVKKAKPSLSLRTIFEYSLEMGTREIVKTEKNREIILKPVVRYQDKYIDDWRLDDFANYIYDSVTVRFGPTYISITELKKRSIVKNGVQGLGRMMKISDLKEQKERYKEFIDWLLEKFIYSKTVTVGNFVSKATFRNFIMDRESKKQSGTVLGNEGADYSKDVEVSF